MTTKMPVQPSAPPPLAAPWLTALRDRWQLLRAGDSATQLSPVQILVGLAVIWAAFDLMNHNFLSASNLTNLALQIVAVGAVSIGVVMVLLIGEIDLSIGSVSGLAATIMATLNVQHGVSPILAIIAAVAAGVVVGLIQGTIVARFGVPSFIVTLAGLIGWSGLQLYIFNYTGAMNLNSSTILGLTDLYFAAWVGWVAALAVMTYLGVSTWWDRRRRAALGLQNSSLTRAVVRLVAAAVVMCLAVYIFSATQGIPLGVLILLGLVVVMDYVTRRTVFGRQMYSIGGDKEAAKRMGINVKTVTIIVFVLAAAFAAFGGLLDASRLQSVTSSAGSGDNILLNAIAGVVIGGTSLFGGRGNIWSAVLGALVIGSIANGMDLLNWQTPVESMVTGGVLVAAVILDATMRKRRVAH